MKIGFHQGFPDANMSQILTLYKEMGVDEIGLAMSETDAVVDTAVKDMVAEAANLGVSVTSVSPRWGWIMRALKDPSEVDRMSSFIKAAPELGTEKIMMSCSMMKSESADKRKEHFDQVVGIYKTISKVAESVGIDLCTHTSSQQGGHIFGSVEGIDGFLEAVGSKRNKLLACCGCLSVPGWDVPALIHHWGDAIGAVHLFNPSGNRDHYDEMRFDLGQMDLFAVLKALSEVGYKGGLISHEYPAFSGDCGKQISDAWVVGYLKAMLQVIGS